MIASTPMSVDPSRVHSHSGFQEVFERQRSRRRALAKRPAVERIQTLRRLRAAIVDRREALAAAIFEDFRKPAAEVEITEVHPTLEEIDHAILNLADWMAPRPVAGTALLAGTRSELRYEPKGVVLVLAPWNYPFNLAVVPLVGAIAAGNCVILKPSEKTPATARFLVSLIREVFDECEVAAFDGDAAFAQSLLELPFDHVFFTGSGRVGRQVMAAAAKHLASVTLELGGKSPAIVDRTADLSAAARAITWGRLLNAGQTCIAPDHVWVHQDVEREFLSHLRASVNAFYGPTEEARQQSPDFARVVDDRSFARLKDLVERTVAGGANLEIGGRFDPATRYIAPTVISGVTRDSPLMEDEIFGPVLPVLRYRDREEIYAAVDRQGKPLVLYVFARKRKLVDDVLASISSGGAVINNTLIQWANPHLPFGGVGASGVGSYHGVFGFKAFSHERSVVVQRWFPLTRMLLPPYGARRRELTGKLIRSLE